MKEKIKEWLRERQKKKLMAKFLGAILNAGKQRKILKQLLACNITNQDLRLLSRGVIDKSVLDELFRFILFNEPCEKDLYHLITVSNDEFIIKMAMKKLKKKYFVAKDDWLSLLENVKIEWVAWEIFNKLKEKGLMATEMYAIMRVVKSESVACFAFKMLLEITLSNYGIPTELIDDEIGIDPRELN